MSERTKTASEMCTPNNNNLQISKRKYLNTYIDVLKFTSSLYWMNEKDLFILRKTILAFKEAMQNSRYQPA